MTPLMSEGGQSAVCGKGIEKLGHIGSALNALNDVGFQKEKPDVDPVGEHGFFAERADPMGVIGFDDTKRAFEWIGGESGVGLLIQMELEKIRNMDIGESVAVTDQGPALHVRLCVGDAVCHSGIP